jgi:hypothetical protein
VARPLGVTSTEPAHLHERARRLRSLAGLPGGRLDGRTGVALLDGVPDLGHAAFRDLPVTVDTSMVDERHPVADAHATAVLSTLVGAAPAVAACAGASVTCIAVLDRSALRGPRGVGEIDVRVAAAIGRAVAAGVVAVQLAFEPTDPDAAMPCTVAAITAAAARGVATIVASGNTGRFGRSSLVAAPGAIPVAAMDDDRRPLPGTGLGATVARRGVLAPGSAVPVAASPQDWVLRGGTSVACAFATAAWAWLRQAEPGAPPGRHYRALADVRGVVPRTVDVDGSLHRLDLTNQSPERNHDGTTDPVIAAGPHGHRIGAVLVPGRPG